MSLARSIDVLRLAAVPAGPLARLLDHVGDWLGRLGASGEVAEIAAVLLVILLIGLLAVAANLVAKRIILRVIDQIVTRTPWQWDNALRDNKVFARLSHLAPALVIDALGRELFSGQATLTNLVQAAVMVYVVVIMLLVASALINTVQRYAERQAGNEGIPVKGFAQAVKLIVFIIGAILILSAVFGQSPLFFFSGLGALTAVLLLIFRDALLGLVAGVMISANQLVRVGDWIEVPTAGADGDVIDVALTTVKVRNWDRTITTIPSYDLIAKSFKNWRGMYDNQGRRIKRSLLIDMQTIGFLDEAAIERLLRIRRLRPYLEAKQQEIAEANRRAEADPDLTPNVRRLTNIGTFRAYCMAYLREHPGILQRELVMVRQRDPLEHGLPLEIYAFTNDTRWEQYEGIQSDIFDHLLAVIGEFGLRVFQDPSGHDMRGAFGRTG